VRQHSADQNVDEPVRLERGQATALLRSIGVDHPVAVSVIHEFNHVYHLQAGNQVFFLKTHTKAWYRGNPQAPANCVRHEQCAWDILARHGVPTPEVVRVATDSANAFGRPFIITRALTGAPLTTLFGHATEAEQRQLLVATGDYLRRMHAITFTHPGYLMRTDGPTTAPTDRDWQHRGWTPQARQRNALALLATRGSELTPALADRLHELFASMAERLEANWTAPRFVHGDCHAHQIFVDAGGASAEVTGVVDMEVASAGDPIEDLLKFSLELAPILPARTRWWQALFDGYGQEPDYESFSCACSVAAPKSLLASSPPPPRAPGPRWCGTSWPRTRGRIYSPMAGESQQTTRDGRPISDEPPFGATVVVSRVRLEVLMLHRAHHGPDYTGSVGKRWGAMCMDGADLRLACCK
jgi:aminoglycoside phosphotransferase (APT) family kinase protein